MEGVGGNKEGEECCLFARLQPAIFLILTPLTLPSLSSRGGETRCWVFIEPRVGSTASTVSSKREAPNTASPVESRREDPRAGGETRQGPGENAGRGARGVGENAGRGSRSSQYAFAYNIKTKYLVDERDSFCESNATIPSFLS